MARRSETDLDFLLSQLRHPSNINKNNMHLHGVQIELSGGRVFVVRSAIMNINRQAQGFHLVGTIFKANGAVLEDYLSIEMVMFLSTPNVVSVKITTQGTAEEFTTAYSTSFKACGLRYPYTLYKKDVTQMVNILRTNLFSPDYFGVHI